jgi:hypothetical protein
MSLPVNLNLQLMEEDLFGKAATPLFQIIVVSNREVVSKCVLVIVRAIVVLGEKLIWMSRL